MSWTTPTLTDMPDSRAKQSAGHLPSGEAFLVNAPSGSGSRLRVFDRAFLLRGAADLQPLRYAGQHKRPGCHYPKSVLWEEHLYVAYATN